MVGRPRHGAPAPIDLTTWLGDDPYLALVTPDPGEWLAAHPCNCEDFCRCDEQDQAQRTA